MQIKLKKQPKKYLLSVTESTRKKLEKGIEDIAELKGDIKN